MEALNQGEEEEEDPDNSLVKSILISAEEKERKSVPLESLKYGVDLLSISHGKYYNKWIQNCKFNVAFLGQNL